MLDVKGMTCGSCIRHIQSALAPLGVERAEVDLRQGRVTVQHDDRAAPVALLIAAIQQAGYPVAPTK
ncbi:MAG: heavy-metal-associated domain-containing protein [Alphaproteobacteria bacterium]|nr:heavy-metal-associated domain-containing protein [Alphaproteobacteria bacterium]